LLFAFSQLKDEARKLLHEHPKEATLDDIIYKFCVHNMVGVFRSINYANINNPHLSLPPNDCRAGEHP
jgi:hypothetical protein